MEFENVNKRLDDMRDDMNKRIDDLRADVDKRFNDLKSDVRAINEKIDKILDILAKK